MRRCCTPAPFFRPGTIAAAAVSLFLIIAASLPAQSGDEAPDEVIMFGSCLWQNRAHPALGVAVEREPDAFVFLGDNVYADSTNPVQIQDAYDRLAQSDLYRELRQNTDVYAVWDDHDYGANDAGADFPAREASERIFENFWDIDGPAASRPGIYRSARFAEGAIQLILLDTRSFRSPLARARPRREGKGPYAPSDDGTILGAEQWEWLERTLRRPAELRIIASSIQVLASHHGWESWANFPHERERLLSLLADSGGPAIFISGDRHFAEISRAPAPPGDTAAPGTDQRYFYDVTSSGINRRYPEEVPTANANRVDGYYLHHNVGELALFRDDEELSIRARIYDEQGGVRLEEVIDLGAASKR
ncbi:MAG: alkaline phosphatase D family protein [Spirochaetia bacterium]